MSFQEGKLEQVLVYYQLPNYQKTATNLHKQQKVGQKPGYHPRKRVDKQRNTCGFEHPYVTEHDDVQKYSIVFIKDTAAHKCYGCKGTIKKDGKFPPPPPFDIFVTTKTFRHYREKSKDGKPGVLHIKTTKENVNYHPQLAWLEKQCAELAENLKIPDHVKFRLTNAHKKKLIWNEFGQRRLNTCTCKYMLYVFVHCKIAYTS